MLIISMTFLYKLASYFVWYSWLRGETKYMRLRSLGCSSFFFLLSWLFSEWRPKLFLARKGSSLYSIFLLNLSLFLFLFLFFQLFAPSQFVFSPHTDNKRLDMLSMLITNRLTERIYGWYFLVSFMLVLVYFVLPTELLFNEMDLVDMDLADCMNYFLVAFSRKSNIYASGNKG